MRIVIWYYISGAGGYCLEDYYCLYLTAVQRWARFLCSVSVALYA